MKLSEFLAEFDMLDLEAGDALKNIAEQVAGLGRKGRLDVQITIEKAGGKIETQVQLVEKPPKQDAESDMWFLHPETGSTREDPFQRRFDFETGEIID